MTTTDAERHVRGESLFVDDLDAPAGTLHAHVLSSPVAHGVISRLDTGPALAADGVVAVLTASDVAGRNQIGGIVEDEELLASTEVHFAGQPLALVVADHPFAARHAAAAIEVEIDPLPVVTDARVAAARGDLIVPTRTFESGDVDAAWNECDVIVEGVAETGGQEHLYLETQAALAVPLEGGSFRITSSTQAPTVVQRVTARVLGLPMHRIEVDVPRLGGGFGGKEDQATAWAALAALAAQRLDRPVKLVLHRQDDMRMTGTRHPYSADFRLGLRSDGTILAWDVTFFQNAGAAADLSPAVLDRTLFHCTNAYRIPNVRAVGHSCRTNLPPNTAFRGFGGPQGMFAIEAALARAAEVLGVPRHELQRKNLLDEGDAFHYGQVTESCQARPSWKALVDRVDLDSLRTSIDDFNRANAWQRRGFAVMPICFGISFTTTMMNQASATVHVYTDGSIGLSTAAVEMGQGVNAKLIRVASQVLGVPPSRIRIESTNTTRIANTSPTAASSGADLNGHATAKACRAILERLGRVAASELGRQASEIAVVDGVVQVDGVATDVTWGQLAELAHRQRVSLSEHAHYATPRIHFDRATNRGHPFAYHVYGTALVEATVDCLRGTYKIDRVTAVHDFGESLHPEVDLSQAAGAIMQGISWLTLEEVLYDDEGHLMTDALSTYKVADMDFAPEVTVHFLEGSVNTHGPFNSKAIGEPPLMYGIGAFFAIRDAMRAFRPGLDVSLTAPLTPERVLLALHGPATA